MAHSQCAVYGTVALFLLTILVTKGAEMTRPHPAAVSQTDELQRQFFAQLGSLQQSIAAGDETSTLEAWHETRNLLDSLPLATDQYDRAVSRLKNCRRYLISSEFGAAVYELKLLIGALELRRASVEKPKRRSIRRQSQIVFHPIEDNAVEALG